MAKTRVLAVDDEEHILELIKYNLEKSGFDVLAVDSGEKALDSIQKEKVDLVLLDWMLTGMSGMDVLREIRKEDSLKHLPVIMLTAKTDEIDKVLGLEMGADDYISKPFGVHELAARIKAVLRRTEQMTKLRTNAIEEDILTVDDLVINRGTHDVVVRGETIELPLKEFELLYILAKNKGRVFDREYLLEKIWGYDYLGETRTVDVHIRNLRIKIEEDDSKPSHIKTVRGVGYKYI